MATSFDPAAGALEFFSTSSLPAGSEVGKSRVRLLAVISAQITMFYGPRSNAELVLHSGFHYAGHQSDFTTIHFGLLAYGSLALLFIIADAKQATSTSHNLQLLSNLSIPM